MSSSFHLNQGSVPLLISMPHNGSYIPSDIASTMTNSGHSSRDTDWFKDKLYQFALDRGAYLLKPRCSRYVIDLNRDPKGVNLYPGANSTELCPTTAFDLAPLYLPNNTPNDQEISRRVKHYWQPYHKALEQTLSEMLDVYGVAILLEAHSIKSEVPRFFDGVLPDFNFGTASGASCDPRLLERIEGIDFTPYSQVSNGRFKGGYITRHYGNPEKNIHAVQLELSQRTYMNEANLTYSEERAGQVIPKLKQLVETLLIFAEEKR